MFSPRIKNPFINSLKDMFHLLVGAYAVMLILFSAFTPIARAQKVIQVPTDVDRRLDEIEKLNLDHRVTIIETTLQDLVSNFSWYRVTSGGTGLLLAEAVYRHAKKKKEDDANEA